MKNRAVEKNKILDKLFDQHNRTSFDLWLNENKYLVDFDWDLGCVNTSPYLSPYSEDTEKLISEYYYLCIDDDLLISDRSIDNEEISYPLLNDTDFDLKQFRTNRKSLVKVDKALIKLNEESAETHKKLANLSSKKNSITDDSKRKKNRLIDYISVIFVLFLGGLFLNWFIGTAIAGPVLMILITLLLLSALNK